MEIITREEAKGKGLKRYFTGEPCPRGHLSERYTSNKTCFDCNKYSTNAMTNVDQWPRVQILYRAKRRAKEKNIEYDLNLKWAKKIWTGKCEITGIKFDLTCETSPSSKSTSLDRIDNNKGYSKDNCRFILHCINMFKGTQSDKELNEVIRALYKNL